MQGIVETWAAPVTVTAVGVFLGLLVEGRFRDVVTRREKRKFFQHVNSQGGWQGVVYDVRDWAHEIRSLVVTGSSLEDLPATIRCPGALTIPHLVRCGQLPEYAHPRALVLAEYAVILRDLVVLALADCDTYGKDSTPLKRRVEEVADLVAAMADELVKDRWILDAMNCELYPFQARVHHSRWKPIRRLGAWLQYNNPHWDHWFEEPFRVHRDQAGSPTRMR